MTELSTTPEVDVQLAEYTRLLGYPRGWVLDGRARELADWARTWYRSHGRPWMYAREAQALDVCEESVAIEGCSFGSGRLRTVLRRAGAHSVLLVAVSAGPELEAEAHRLWRDERPDEYFFLEVFGSAVVEQLTAATGARLCAWAETEGMAVLSHYSPGYPDWDIAEQRSLLDLIARGGDRPLPGAIDVLDSGALRPKKSLLAVFGVTRHAERLQRLADLIPCENCSYEPCQFRRMPYRQAPTVVSTDAAWRLDTLSVSTADVPPPVPRYTVNPKALQRWADERLHLEMRHDGSVHVTFRYDGTTCTNMGRPLTFTYAVTLGPREEGYPIRSQRCGPASGDTGHTYMCEYVKAPETLLSAIDREHPLSGRPLNDVLSWERPAAGAGCYCEPASREHKWGLVFETIHFALRSHELIAGSQSEDGPRS
jgi:hypothetical protein